MAYDNRGKGGFNEGRVEKKPSRPYENRLGDDPKTACKDKVNNILNKK